MVRSIPDRLRIGTRTSPLARRQTALVAAALGRLASDPGSVEVPVMTEGDRLLDRPLPEIGGKGVFTEALERALRDGEIDIAVHSLKDLPVEQPAGLRVAAICFRADPRDVLIARAGASLESLPGGASVGTSSTRRAAQLRALRPDLRLLPLRGNVGTRIRKAQGGEYDAIVLAAAGLIRLGLEDAITAYLPLEQMLPAPGQGALAVQCRTDDPRTSDLLARLDDPGVRAAVEAEREFLAGLGGGCSAPVAAHASPPPEAAGQLRLMGRVLALDGSRMVQVEGTGPLGEARELGRRLAQQARDSGAAEFLT